jgi:hypothetical protein
VRTRILVLAIGLSLFGLAATPASQAHIGPVPAQLVQLPLGPGGFQSANISYEGTLAFDSPGVSARVMQVGAVRRLYVSTAKSLSVYNVTNPALPLLMGTIAFYNFENEDLAVSKDGQWVLSTEFTAGLYLHVFKVTDLPGGLVALTLEGTTTGGDHTVECIDDACNYAYGSEGNVWDLRDKADPHTVGDGYGPGGHHVTRDATGLIWSDTSPIRAYDVSEDPLHPKVVAESSRPSMTQNNTAYQHNNIRPFAQDYAPRVTDEEKADPNLRPGEILLGEGETNFTVDCNQGGVGNGPFATYDLRNFDQPGAPAFKVKDVFRPVSGQYANGDPAVNAMGCSGHWFDVSPLSTHEKIITTNGWYDHGTRIFEIDGKTAKIKQIGFFQPVVGAASASYWIDNQYIYTVDYERGIDILKFDPNVPTPTKAVFNASWLAKLHTPPSIFTRIEQYVCRQAVLRIK